MKTTRTGLLALALLAAGCAERSVVKPVSVAQRPRLIALDRDQCRRLVSDDATPQSLRTAISNSLTYLEKTPSDRSLLAVDRNVSADSLSTLLTSIAASLDSSDWSERVCDLATVYRVDAPEGLLATGYYQPELPASRTRSSRFRYPLYRAPDDLIDADLRQWCPECSRRVVQGRVKDGRLIPYYSRSEIDAGALERRGDEIAWLDDPIDVFFMHVQGSAVLRFDDGVQMHVSYSNSNGRPYTSIGRVLIDRGKLTRSNLSMQALKDYLRGHPDEQAEIMGNNERYIFFRAVTKGPIGSIGVPLTAGRSIAADASVYPPGGLAFMKIEPLAESADKASTSRFALIQDAGVAITGPGRIDVYWGTGGNAEAIAGGMRNPGELYLVLPRE